MPRLFELCDQQWRPLIVTEREGTPVVRLRRGAQITSALVEELDQLLAGDYFGHHQVRRHHSQAQSTAAEFFADILARCLPSGAPCCDGPSVLDPPRHHHRDG